METDFSAGDEDAQLRPSLVYQWSDAVTATAGANIMAGDDPTFFGWSTTPTPTYVFDVVSDTMSNDSREGGSGYP